ncbi:MAG: NAD+ synthase [Phycisphaerales bacterium]
MRVALAQLDPTVGDVAGNARRLADAARDAAVGGADLLVAPELLLVGYPPRDLLERAGLAEACLRAAEDLASAFPSLAMLVGLPRAVPGDPRPLRNSGALLRDGRVEAFADKRLLPSYDVFEEDRFFSPGERSFVFEHAGRRCGVAICEDLWRAQDAGAVRGYTSDPIADLAEARCELVFAPSASPFVRGKHTLHLAHLAATSRRLGGTIVSVNQAGANDELVFDGGSAIARRGSIEHVLPRFREAVAIVDPSIGGCAPAGEAAWEQEVFEAIVAGIRGYARKTGHRGVLLGLSGGLDSALVAALASAALGASNVRGVLLPSRHSSDGSRRDARESARRLGIGQVHELPIEAAHAALSASLEPAIGAAAGIVDENLQSRARGTLLMAIANATGELLLTTGNKSEMAVGYATLYGDMNGGLAPIGDLLKTDAYSLARWINGNGASLGFAEPPIPEASIEKPPSAELRPDQTDQDSLPPYEQLDAVIRGWVEESRGVEAIAATAGIARAEVRALVRSIDRMEFKRKQAPPILKLSRRAFGRGRPMPLAGAGRLDPPAP